MNTTSHLPRRTLGKTGLAVSEVGFGAWAIGGNWGEEIEEEAALSALHAGMDAGMNFIDTADVYGGGRSERLIGRLLRERSGERLIVATKIGRGGPFDGSFTSVENAVASCRANMGVEQLDLVQLHCVPMEVLRGPVWEHLETLRERGWIGAYGASVESIEEALYCIHHTGASALQVIFNIFRQRLIAELFPAAQAANVGLIARVPLASGILTGKFGANHTFAPDDHRAFNANGEAFNAGETFAGVPFDRGVELAAKIRAIVGEAAPLSALALRWILDFPAIGTVIPGAKSPAQAGQNALASALPRLSDEAHQKLSELYLSDIEPLIRGAY